jgi:hypothetical protein
VAHPAHRLARLVVQRSASNASRPLVVSFRGLMPRAMILTRTSFWCKNCSFVMLICLSFGCRMLVCDARLLVQDPSLISGTWPVSYKTVSSTSGAVQRRTPSSGELSL